MELLEGNDYLRSIDMYDGPHEIHAFTGHVQKVLCKVMFPDPGPPKPGIDSDAVMADKRMYHEAYQASKRFQDDYVQPYKETKFGTGPLAPGSIAHDVLHALRTSAVFTSAKNPLTSTVRKVKRSAWSNTLVPDNDAVLVRLVNGHDEYELYVDSYEAEHLRALHVAHHLDKYITAIVAEAVTGMDKITSFAQLWRQLATDKYATVPVSNWPNLSGIEFVDRMADVFWCWNAFMVYAASFSSNQALD